MSQPIQIGDLVVVLLAHCEGDESIGRIFRVAEHWLDGYVCPVCKHITYRSDAFSPGDEKCYERSWLKRIPPFPELKDERHDEEITA